MPIKIFLWLIIFGGVFYLGYYIYPLLEKSLFRWEKKKAEKMTPKLNAMFMDVPTRKLILIDILGPLASGIFGYILTHNWVFALMFALLGLALPFFVVKRLQQARKKKFAGQLVDALMILSSSLKAGLSLIQSFESLVEEMPAPISQEFSLVTRQVQMGVSLEEAMSALKKRMQVDELDMVVSSIMVARETGGNLTDIFSQVAVTIQERNKLIGRVNALCVQGKLQGAIMSILPIVFGFVVYKVDPHFFEVFLQDNMGRMFLGYAIVSEIIGVILIRKLSKVDV